LLYGAAREFLFFAEEVRGLRLRCGGLGVFAVLVAIVPGVSFGVFGLVVDAVNP
jgi:hypothetical protein